VFQTLPDASFTVGGAVPILLQKSVETGGEP
jgi:hypothetical protein